ncbi:MAG: hypothetical protein KC635_20250 [Myxococcales bacterium]|nr:hypothetical protein [Myxococcales bacterium]MCB9733571.1 hypothetical protein [Deltaproteobacteria bacterium]
MTPAQLAEKLLWRVGERLAGTATALERQLAPPPPAVPVDAVVTWAGPDNEARRAERRRWAQREGAAESEGSWRFADHGELRYALRGLVRNAPFLRRIHVVVADTGPSWLRTDDPALAVVPHRAIFPDPEHLPTWSSCAIEAHLHRIPDLAERFLYLNDDMLILAPMTLGDAVDARGRVKLEPQWRAGRFPRGAPRAEDQPHIARARLTNALLDRRYGARLRLWPIHQARMGRRTAYEAMHADPIFAPELARVSAARFRRGDVIDPIYLQYFVALHTGLARLSSRSSSVVRVQRNIAAMTRDLARVQARRPAQLCVQDWLDGDAPEVTAALQGMLEILLPGASRFER